MDARSFAAIAISSLLLLGCVSGPPRSTQAQIDAASALSPTEHLALASEREALAKTESATSLRYASCADQERRTRSLLNQGRSWASGPFFMLGHCETLSGSHAKAADDARLEAQRHRALAQGAR